MTDPSLIEREHKLLADLAQQAAVRAQAEVNAEAGVRSRQQNADNLLRETHHQLTSQYNTDRQATQREYDATLADLKTRFDSKRTRTEQEFSDALEQVESRYRATQDEAQAERRDARWMASTVYETSGKEADRQRDEQQWHVQQGLQTLQGIREASVGLLTEWRLYRPQPDPQPRVSLDSALDDYTAEFERALAGATSLLDELKQLRTPRFFKGLRLVGINVALGAVLVVAGVSRFGLPLGLMVGVAATAAVGGGLTAGLFFFAKSRVARIDAAIRQALGDAEAIANQCLQQAAERHKAEMRRLKQVRDDEQRRADENCLHILRDAKGRRDDAAHEARERYPRLIDKVERAYEATRAEAQQTYPRRLEQLDARYGDDVAQAEQQHRQAVEASNLRFEDEWNATIAAWRSAVAEAAAIAASVNEQSRLLFPDWAGVASGDWSPPEAAPPVVLLGQVELAMKTLPHGLPAHPRLEGLTPEGFTLPALLPFPGDRPLLLTTNEAGSPRAIETLHALMLRLLTSLPPGKVRFSIVDPVGLGQNFAAFMRLADYDESMVSKRIWTEPDQIERRLADLTEHMENVIQKYLRNEFESIEAYNVRAGEVAEPYRFLVVAGFPVNFNDEAMRRLGRILASGPRCGVHTLLIAEPSRPISKSVPGLQLEGQCNHLAWREGTFVWKSSPFEPFALRLADPPGTAGFIRILERVGQAARDAKRVEVPFDVVLPPRDQWWSRDSRDGIRVPLGRVGANRLQQLDLGRGTAQHVLIAGKTGSGKSTLLNVLITSLSFHYSPEQVELYLVDFKKGVEFKAYAAHDLPHARVIAVESDREFGLSVLERLDAEIQRRGEAFRKHRVQDLAAYREATGPGGLPRILLIVDEFQEFFVEDDRIAQDAALLLDRLVRQGRAFGIHVLLGSQTVSGAYSLARSTLSQMAVRIALECSETDAHLILNEDNTAAALLARPGEAIYNDAGGLVDGNSPFQTAWLSDAAREGYLRKLRELARQRNYLPPTPQVVFEGNVPADVTANRVLARWLAEPNGSAAATEHRAWLGDAVAIKEPTCVVFRPQSGSNLLIVGQQAEGALSIMATTLISLAAGRGTLHPQNGAAAARFYLLDGSSADGPAHRFFERLASVVPFPCEVVGARDLARVLGEVAADVEGRQQGDEVDGPDVYVFLYDIGRFRDLRRSEDDLFSTSSDDEPAKPADLLAAIVRDGPPVGVHTLVWCDSMSNLNRTLDRAGLREFDSTVLFQMSADDSSSLIDSPSANKLGVGRALVYSEEQGTLEKFRPYALPTDDWLEWVREQFRVRV